MWIFLLILCVHMTHSSQDQTLFNSASEFYCKQAYQQALQTLQQIERKDAATWFNMGNVAYALDDHLHAYLYWMRAGQHGNAQIFNSATHAIEQLADPFVQPVGAMHSWLWWLSKYSLLWQSISLLLWYALLYMLYQRYISKIYIVLVVLLLALAVPIIVSYRMQKERCMIMQDVAVYNGPNRSFYQIAQLSPGRVVVIKDCMHEWCKISFDTHTGWIEQQYVERI